MVQQVVQLQQQQMAQLKLQEMVHLMLQQMIQLKLQQQCLLQRLSLLQIQASWLRHLGGQVTKLLFHLQMKQCLQADFDLQNLLAHHLKREKEKVKAMGSSKTDLHKREWVGQTGL